MDTLGNKAFLFLAPLRESRITYEQLLIVQQNIGNCDRSAIQLAERGNAAIVIRVVVEIILLIAFILILVAFLCRNRNIEDKVFALLLAHDRIVVDRCIDQLSISLLGLPSLRAAGIAKNSGFSRDLLQHFCSNSLVLLFLVLDLCRCLLLSLSLIFLMILDTRLLIGDLIIFTISLLLIIEEMLVHELIVLIVLILLICDQLRLRLVVIHIDIDAIDIRINDQVREVKRQLVNGERLLEWHHFRDEWKHSFLNREVELRCSFPV